VSRKKEDTLKKNTLGAITIVSVGGAINKVASFILVYALVFVDASVQYPMVTGGVMIVSTLLCYFGDRKPSRKELISVAISFLGMLALFLIPV
jgi:drug/metabolite transporter (DMT)-like permease